MREPEHELAERLAHAGHAELISAAAAYNSAFAPETCAPARWPWNSRFWKPGDRVRNLECAGALYLAAGEAAAKAGEHSVAERCREAWAPLIADDLERALHSRRANQTLQVSQAFQ